MKVLTGDAKNKLVEFMDWTELRRVWMPQSEALTLENCRRGIDVGLTVEDIEALGLCIDAKKFLYGLHRRGLWTLEDLQRPGGTRAARSALLEAVGWALTQLINLYQDRR